MSTSPSSKPKEAKAAFERALAIYAELLASNPDNRVALVSSTLPLMRLGELDEMNGRGYLGKALAILKRLDGADRLETRHKASIPWIEQRLKLAKASAVPL
jgi:hypothetical protein